jgi:predicted helicase
LVSNDSFVDQIAFDGMRRHLERDFSEIYVLDLGGNVRKNPKLSGTKHNVFGIQVGVAITVLVRNAGNDTQVPATIFYARMGEDWSKEQKFAQLDKWRSLKTVDWETLNPDERHTWLTKGQQKDFDALIPLGIKGSKDEEDVKAIFRSFSLGIVSARDSYVFNFNRPELERAMRTSIKAYAETLATYRTLEEPRPSPDDVVEVDDARVKWSRQTKRLLGELHNTHFSRDWIRNSLYRPFTRQFLYFDDFWNEERYQLPHILPLQTSENTMISATAPGFRSQWSCFATSLLPTYTLCSTTDSFQCFPIYIYDEDGSNRRENITDWALAEFRSYYGQHSITKLDIFHYVYALLHHPEYRTRYAANLKRELPRIPFAPDFSTYARIGCELMKLHIDYEQQPEYPLQRTETGRLDWRVEKMVLSKDKTQLRYNSFLSFGGIPHEVYEYRLGNRSALEWIVDQYRVSTDKRSGIVNDPNRADDPEYIVRLIGQVVTVSLETVKLVRELATLPLLPPA